jgi:two-component system, OmpR family, alkaline phosphatase synthesis response regulator PhoP
MREAPPSPPTPRAYQSYTLTVSAKSILVVDDEPRIAEIARDYLERGGFHVSVAGTGPDALAAARLRHPDLIVLDLGLPHMDGLDVMRALRKQSNVPIIILTARVDERDKLAGLELGADDYVTKPFSPRELVARVRAVFRRVDGAQQPGEVISAGELTLDRRTLRASLGARAIDVTPTEFALLATLARQPGRVFTRAQLLDAIRGSDAESFDRAIDAHVKNLRRKIEPDQRRPRYLLTVHGVGYKFAD